MLLARRGLLRGTIGLLAMPAIVRADALMRISAPKQESDAWIAEWIKRWANTEAERLNNLLIYGNSAQDGPSVILQTTMTLTAISLPWSPDPTHRGNQCQRCKIGPDQNLQPPPPTGDGALS